MVKLFVFSILGIISIMKMILVIELIVYLSLNVIGYFIFQKNAWLL